MAAGACVRMLVMFHPQSASREMDASAQIVIYFRYSLGPLSMIGAPHSDWVVLPQLSLSKKKTPHKEAQRDVCQMNPDRSMIINNHSYTVNNYQTLTD